MEAYSQSWSLELRYVSLAEATAAARRTYPEFADLRVSCWFCPE